MPGSYDDIIHQERPVSRFHSPMPLEERAAQFSPFAALTGYEGIIREAARFTARRVELDQDAQEELNRALVRLAEAAAPPGEGVEVRLTWFVPDGLKLGGEYRTRKVRVRRVDPVYQVLELADHSMIPFDALLSIGPIPEDT